MWLLDFAATAGHVEVLKAIITFGGGGGVVDVNARMVVALHMSPMENKPGAR